MNVTVDKVLQLEAMVKQLEADKQYLIESYNQELQRLLRLLQQANRKIDKLKQEPLQFGKEPYRVDK